MSDMLIINARLVDPATTHDRMGWLYVRNGLIADTDEGDLPAAGRPDGAVIIDAKGAVLAPALVDVGVNMDPTGSHGDTWPTLQKAAAAGGVSTVIIAPSAQTPLDTPDAMAGLISLAKHDAGDVHLHGLAPLTTPWNTGENLAELTLLHHAGAIGFVSSGNDLRDLHRLRQAMLYAGQFNTPILASVREPNLETGAIAGSGDIAHRFGLPGAPTVAEHIAASTLHALAQDTQTPLILDGISTNAGLAGAGLPHGDHTAAIRHTTSASSTDTPAPPLRWATPATALMFNDIDTGTLDPAFRLSPPLRSEDDRTGLVDAVYASTRNAIIRSQHWAAPLHTKRQLFAEAAPGAPGLETLLSAVLSTASQLDIALADALAPVTTTPRNVYDLPGGSLKVGEPADLVVFDPHAPWVCRPDALHTSGRITPFAGRRLLGMVKATIIGGHLAWDAMSPQNQAPAA